MQCRTCGTEIADKAIVCFRCGASTTDPVRKPVDLAKRRRNPFFSLAVVALLLLIALYLGQASRTAANPDTLQTIAGVLTGAALFLLIVRLVRRR
jgi:hypothetical protein